MYVFTNVGESGFCLFMVYVTARRLYITLKCLIDLLLSVYVALAWVPKVKSFLCSSRVSREKSSLKLMLTALNFLAFLTISCFCLKYEKQTITGRGLGLSGFRRPSLWARSIYICSSSIIFNEFNKFKTSFSQSSN